MNRLCPHSQRKPARVWIQNQNVQVLTTIVDKQADSADVLMLVSKTLRQRLRRHLNHIDASRRVRIADAQLWLSLQPPEVLRHAYDVANRAKVRTFIRECIEAHTAQVQVGEPVAKLFQKPQMKKKTVYFGVVDVVYDKTKTDFSIDRYCHVTYEDNDAEDFSYTEYKKAVQFYVDHTRIGSHVRMRSKLCLLIYEDDLEIVIIV